MASPGPRDAQSVGATQVAGSAGDLRRVAAARNRAEAASLDGAVFLTGPPGMSSPAAACG
jgi:hypothetical protein